MSTVKELTKKIDEAWKGNKITTSVKDYLMKLPIKSKQDLQKIEDTLNVYLTPEYSEEITENKFVNISRKNS